MVFPTYYPLPILNIHHSIDGFFPQYWWFPSTVLMVSLNSTDGIPQQYWWYPSTVLMVSLTNVIIQQYCHILWIILNCHLHPFSSPQGSRISARWGCYWFSLSSSFPSAVYSTRISKIVVAVNHHPPPQRLHWSQSYHRDYFSWNLARFGVRTHVRLQFLQLFGNDDYKYFVSSTVLYTIIWI